MAEVGFLVVAKQGRLFLVVYGFSRQWFSYCRVQAAGGQVSAHGMGLVAAGHVGPPQTRSNLRSPALQAHCLNHQGSLYSP